MGIYVQGAAEYHRRRQFFLYNMHLALHIRYVQVQQGISLQFFLYRVQGMVHNACSRVSQGHAG